MTLDELNQVDVNDPNQVKALQNFLKSRGYYAKAIDGKWGGDTIEAVKSLRADFQTESSNRTRTAEAGAETEKARNSWERVAQEVGPYVGGAAAGGAAGYGLMRSANTKDAALKDEISRMAGDKRVQPGIAEKTLDSRMKARRFRTGAQFLAPAAAFGAAEFTRDYIKPRVDPESQRYVDMAANAEQGVGIGLGSMLLKDAIFRSNPVGADTEALIRSRAADVAPGRLAQALTSDMTPDSIPAAMDTRPAPVAQPAEADASQPPAKQRNRDRLVTAAKEAGASGPLTKAGAAEHLLSSIDDGNRGAVAKSLGVSNGPNLHKRLMASIKDMASTRGASAIGPLAAGLLAYDATTSGARAAGAEKADARMQGAAAGGVAAGGAYGISKLAQALGPTVSGALATGGTMMAPMAAADAYDPTPTRLLQDRVQTGELARKIMPEGWAARIGGPVEQAYQMAQLPERGDRSDETMIARAQAAQQDTMPLPTAEALTIPEGIPAPNPDGSSPFPAPIMGRLSRMQKHGATPEQIAHFLNQAVR